MTSFLGTLLNIEIKLKRLKPAELEGSPEVENYNEYVKGYKDAVKFFCEESSGIRKKSIAQEVFFVSDMFFPKMEEAFRRKFRTDDSSESLGWNEAIVRIIEFIENSQDQAN